MIIVFKPNPSEHSFCRKAVYDKNILFQLIIKQQQICVISLKKITFINLKKYFVLFVVVF